MPSKKAVVQIAGGANKQVAVIPEPPNDLWERMDALNAQYGFREPIEELPGDMTTEKYMRKYNVSYSVAKQRLKTLLDTGHLELRGVGINQKHFYRIKK